MVLLFLIVPPRALHSSSILGESPAPVHNDHGQSVDATEELLHRLWRSWQQNASHKRPRIVQPQMHVNRSDAQRRLYCQESWRYASPINRSRAESESVAVVHQSLAHGGLLIGWSMQRLQVAIDQSKPRQSLQENYAALDHSGLDRLLQRLCISS
jgi:hypothetical protein